MRVIAGQFRSRILKTLPGLDVRPTPDRLREALFNILAPTIEGTTFLDAYAGTGSVGIEALSRGALRVTFIERSRPALNIIRENLRSLGALDRADVISGRAPQELARRSADIVFIDPPYRLTGEYAASMDALAKLLPPLVIVQHDSHYRAAEQYGGLHQFRTVKQGDNVLSFYRPAGE